ncbi:GNAT family N-acetyltransferase, partial [Flavobacteriaceae bacterium]|nr:GNAT family N-acetyltransferase [Flavobacteriaceae bacterium]
MDFHLREAVKSDMKGVWSLIHELAVFEKEPQAVEVSIADLERDGFGS